MFFVNCMLIPEQFVLYFFCSFVFFSFRQKSTRLKDSYLNSRDIQTPNCAPIFLFFSRFYLLTFKKRIIFHQFINDFSDGLSTARK